jgi:hypothetical protein
MYSRSVQAISNEALCSASKVEMTGARLGCQSPLQAPPPYFWWPSSCRSQVGCGGKGGGWWQLGDVWIFAVAPGYSRVCAPYGGTLGKASLGLPLLLIRELTPPCSVAFVS